MGESHNGGESTEKQKEAFIRVGLHLADARFRFCKWEQGWLKETVISWGDQRSLLQTPNLGVVTEPQFRSPRDWAHSIQAQLPLAL